MYFIINLSGSQQFSGSSIQNQVELSEWATGRFMHCNYIFILDLTPGFNWLGKDNCKTRRGKFKFCDLVRLILETLRTFFFHENMGVSAWTHHFHAKYTIRILQLAHQDPVVPAESTVHPQNPVYTYSMHLIAITPFAFTREITVCTILHVSGD